MRQMKMKDRDIHQVFEYYKDKDHLFNDTNKLYTYLKNTIAIKPIEPHYKQEIEDMITYLNQLLEHEKNIPNNIRNLMVELYYLKVRIDDPEWYNYLLEQKKVNRTVLDPMVSFPMLEKNLKEYPEIIDTNLCFKIMNHKDMIQTYSKPLYQSYLKRNILSLIDWEKKNKNHYAYPTIKLLRAKLVQARIMFLLTDIENNRDNKNLIQKHMQEIHQLKRQTASHMIVEKINELLKQKSIYELNKKELETIKKIIKPKPIKKGNTPKRK